MNSPTIEVSKIDLNITLEKVTLISRDSLDAISMVVVNGVTHSLGEHRDFRRNDFLLKFIPENARLGIAWVRLGVDEILYPHVHPIESMIIICEGEGEFIGDSKFPLKNGDIVAVPRGAKHGFRGRGSAGFTALSIQFEQSGFYENVDKPLVKFVDNS